MSDTFEPREGEKFDPNKAKVGPLAQGAPSYSPDEGMLANTSTGGDGSSKEAADEDAGSHLENEEYEPTIDREQDDVDKEAILEEMRKNGDLDQEKTANQDRSVSAPEKALPGDFDPNRKVPDLNQRSRQAQNYSSEEEDIPTHDGDEMSPDVREMVENTISGDREVQIDESETDIVAQEAKETENEHEVFQDYPTDVSVDRRDEVYSRASGYTIDSTRSAMPKSASVSISELHNPDIHPVRLKWMLDQQWGEEWTDWEPETLTEMIDREGIDCPMVNRDKMMAIKVLVNRPEKFFTHVRTFEKICLAFSGYEVDWGAIQEPRTHDIAAVVTLVRRVFQDGSFDDNVRSFVAASALRDGYAMLPPSLKFASKTFSNKLVETMGDDALHLQQRLMQALEQEDPSNLDENDVIQYVRILRCQYQAEEMIEAIQ